MTNPHFEIKPGELWLTPIRATRECACKWARVYGKALGAYFHVYQVADGRWTFDNAFDPAYLENKYD